MIIRGETILAAGALLPLAETTLQAERYGTRHRAALGITEQTDALVVVVSEETGQASLVERARIRRNLDEAQLARAISRAPPPGAAVRTAIRDRLGAAGVPGRCSADVALGDLGRSRGAARATATSHATTLPARRAGAGTLTSMRARPAASSSGTGPSSSRRSSSPRSSTPA